MGRDKALLDIAGMPLIERTVTQLEGRFAELLVSVRHSEDYPFITHRKVADRLPGQGPLMAIACSLECSRTDLNFFVSCDVPELSFELIERLLQAARRGDGAVAVTSEGRVEPLFAVYRKSLLSAITEHLARGHRKVTDIYAGHEIIRVSMPADVSINNLNTMADYQNYCAFIHAPSSR
jgi:molybdopterin-guanine dinucleotide biosynthesis protein A